ncbi:hypothetical protein [Rugamonas apoptosis]|uniref:hypothetical protein n=1 Tax=Rugamonas apoptosis TaxID=2758570 RepID=UPI001E3AF951|nr:hypothetical protein [Rugamonas apoptosis]
MNRHGNWRQAKLWTAALALCALLPAAQARDWTLRVDGAGPLKVGMRFDTVNKILGEHMERVPSGQRTVPTCFQVTPADQDGILLMFVKDVLKRVDVTQPGIESERGVALDDPEGQVRRHYGEAVRTAAHPGRPGAHYLTVKAGEGQYAIRFETDQGRVAAMYAGALAQVLQEEGCQ